MEEKIATKTALDLLAQSVVPSVSDIETGINTFNVRLSEFQNNNRVMSKKDILDIIGTIVPVGDEYKNFYVKALDSADLSWNVDNVQYSVNGGEWNDWNSSNSLSLDEGDIVEFSGVVGTNRAFRSTGDIKLGGNLLSIKFGEDFLDNTGSVNYSYLFTTNSHVVDAGDLVLQNENAPAPYCNNMFQGCSALVVPPKLPWQLVDTGSSYRNMFAECISLETPPDLPSTHVPSMGYDGMFRTCSALRTPPEFPRNLTARWGAFSNMFASCSVLESFPEVDILPSGSANGLYERMFMGCTSLQTVGIGFVGSLTGGFSCRNMFTSCSSLINAPRVVDSGSFQYTSNQVPFEEMFAGCTSLTETLKLPEYTAQGADFPAFNSMYKNCTSLTDASDVRITGYSDSNGYADFQSMFEGCTNLVSGSVIDFISPMVSGSWRHTGICNNMYRSCSNLSYIKCILPTTSLESNPAQDNFSNWVAGVSPTGTFVKNAGANYWTTGTSGIPTGWTVQEVEIEIPTASLFDTPLTVEALEDGYLSWTSGKSRGNVSYSKNGSSWQSWPIAGLSVSAGDQIAFKATASVTYYQTDDSTQALHLRSSSVSSSPQRRFNVYGNIASLLSPNFETMSAMSTATMNCQHGAFERLFQGSGVVDASRLVIPFTNMGHYAFVYAFDGCTNLIATPELPATDFYDYYDGGCYEFMFRGCTSLTQAPELPATQLKMRQTYYGMFQGCTSLTKAPVLPATTLTRYCYANMFNGCTNLNEITCLATSRASNDTTNWVSGVGSSGTFIKNSGASWSSGVSAVPSGWTIQNYVG